MSYTVDETVIENYYSTEELPAIDISFETNHKRWILFSDGTKQDEIKKYNEMAAYLVHNIIIQENISVDNDIQWQNYIPNIEERFAVLAIEWKNYSMFRSSITELINHSSYRQIIKLGEDVVPLILEELKKEPRQWFSALIKITGVDPTTDEIQGDVKKMAEAWLQWGEHHNLI